MDLYSVRRIPTFSIASSLGNFVSNSASYQVNALGQRVVKTSASGIATVYHYDSTGRLIAESDAQGNAQTEYLYLGDIPVAVMQ